eukprot:347947-Chlamydomonas_euryale.AAC.3
MAKPCCPMPVGMLDGAALIGTLLGFQSRGEGPGVAWAPLWLQPNSQPSSKTGGRQAACDGAPASLRAGSMHCTAGFVTLRQRAHVPAL